MEAKKARESFTVKNSHVLPPDTNSHGTLFGGKLMAYIDDIAAIAAVRHCRQPVVTASIDSVDFLHPVFEGHAICLEAFVTWTHNTSMEVFVKAITEDLLSGERKVCTTAFVSMVAVNEENKPVPIPAVYPETDQEKRLHAGASARHDQRKERRKESKELAEIYGTGLPW
ncbi:MULTISPECIES: acyl-CoA thioesterase [Salimicrobium]|uniref:Acyl-CoA thioesterase n=1 Tax=Salimicrobium humidisoli TaxID=2029857 RepID=A0ABX4HPA4_9BACI|nr:MULTISPECIES: acyl-CoA thioesterase [Salimicrobium]PBB04888.1 acyl-CoA thioesterase [Salimicrobium humidisoli]